MNEGLREILAGIESARHDLCRSVADMSQELLDTRPSADAWSAGEILHHLYLIEKSLTRGMEKGLGEAERRNVPAGAGPDETVIHSLDRYSIETNPLRASAPARVIPSRAEKKEDLLAALERSRSELLLVFEKASAHDLSEARFPHPIFGDLNVYQWMVFLGKHERRHTRQIVETRRALAMETATAGISAETV